MSRKVSVRKSVFAADEQYASKIREMFKSKGILMLNIIGSPGAGKTTLLEATIKSLPFKTAVIEGDVATSRDAERIAKTGAPVIQINTQGGCHLEAHLVWKALQNLPMEEVDIIFVENVGNLVCPSAFELGETAKIAVLSVAEGDDKPAKYPAIFAKSRALVINKIDLHEAVGQVDFNIERVKADCHKLNQDIKIFPVSAKTGAGMTTWCDWLKSEVKNLTGRT